jgi:A/G-specific adenine glycosylase
MRKHVDQEALEEVASTRKRNFQNLLLKWAEKNLREFPWRKNPTPYVILVTEVLLRRTTASAVLRIYHAFMKEYSDPRKIAAVEETKLASFLSSIGYHKQRAKILKTIAKFLIDEFNSVVPCSKESLLEIPHVGSYTAGAILSLGCSQPSAMVDTNVERVYGRVFLSNLPKKGKRRFIDRIAAMYVLEDNHKVYNLTLLDLAALVCTYGIPRCGICPINGLCDYFSQGLPRR